jgi:hypothetical protein
MRVKGFAAMQLAQYEQQLSAPKDLQPLEQKLSQQHTGATPTWRLGWGF